jgi:hypothetical protein
MPLATNDVCVVPTFRKLSNVPTGEMNLTTPAHSIVEPENAPTIDILGALIRGGLLRQLALFVAILLSGGHLFYPRLPLLALFVFLILLAPQNPMRRMHKAIAPAICVVVAVLLIEILRLDSGLAQVAIRGANFLAALLLLNTYFAVGRDVFQRDLYKVLRFFPLQALATVGLAYIAPGLFTLAHDSGVYGFGYLLYYHVGALGLARPDGFFWEPGIFQIFLNLYLFMAVWLYRSKTDAALAIVAIILTQSTTGLLVLALQILAFLAHYVWQYRGKGKIVIVAMLLPILLVVAGVASQVLFEKMTGEFRGSFYARNFDTVAGLQVAMDHPMLGIGFNADAYASRSSSIDIAVGEYNSSSFNQGRGNTNGIVTFLYTMGVVLGSIFLVALLRQTAFRSVVVVPLILLVSLLAEPLTLTPFFLFLAFSGFAWLYPGIKRSRWFASSLETSK